MARIYRHWRRDSAASRWRLGLALCASAVVHAWLLVAPGGALSTRPPAVPASSAMTVRIEVLGAKATVPDSILAEATGRTRSLAILGENAGSESIPGLRTPRSSIAAPVSNKKAGPTLFSPPPGLDATWYTAQELDSYPRAETPVRLEPAASTGTGDAEVRLLLWLRIDEHGEVVDVSAGAPGIPVHWVEAARMSLAAVRFAPARKDERAVKSRLLLSVSFSAAGER